MSPSDRNKPGSTLFMPRDNFYRSSIRNTRSQPFYITPVYSKMAVSKKRFSMLTLFVGICILYFGYDTYTNYLINQQLRELREDVDILLEISRTSIRPQSSQTTTYRIIGGENGQSGSEPNRESTALLQLNDLHISVKTSKKFHHQRLDIILRTWFSHAKNQIYFITDEEDEEFKLKTDGHLIISGCSNSHDRKALCCKMAMELDFFLSQNKKWFCHFDDDNYVNVWNLLDMLRGYDYAGQWYLGKISTNAAVELQLSDEDQNAVFQFATGGAGFCLSYCLVEKMKPLISGGKFMSIAKKTRAPDDVTVGYIVGHLLKVPLTVIERFHSHLEPLHLMDLETLKTQISFGYSTNPGNQMNRVSVSGWDTESDPTRFLSLDCVLRPDDEKRDCPTVPVSV
ncbi:fringe glycosyltransferase-like [Paramacrobiotus metropolitanus]|uniref:fringe glycosyltransferase-like n=1 Tax=Paramacrobiotus metropolitanus TaxID=2943436 RepID=UPI002445DFAB|nr:fringe glycosyltransferase-like [Paramacrobiotus metropolitanus]